MSRLRLLLLLAGAGTLLAGLPAHAAVRTSSEPAPTGAAASESRAISLLSAASRAARMRTYSGTQYVSTWQDDVATSGVADVSHTAATGTVVHPRATAAGDSSVTPTPDLDPRLLRLLAQHYVLAVAESSSAAGRSAQVVEARRPGGSVAGRFWVDDATALVLRRETFDAAGRLIRSSAFAVLKVGPIGVERAPAALTAEGVDAAAVEDLRRDGWDIPATLEGLELYDARVRTHDGKPVLHLSYSDGLSTLSLFAQRGRLGATRMAGFTRKKLGAGAVWVRSSSPERVVWGGGGRVFTLLSDAPAETVRAAVTVLPHEKAPRTGLLARLGRGLARLGSWLNPFD